MPYYSTLGFSPNSFLDTYRVAFLEKLRNIWSIHCSLTIPSDDFLLYPDIHTLLLAIPTSNNSNKDDLLAILNREYELYLIHGNSYLHKQKELIGGTNIALTMKFHNPDYDKHTHPDHKKNKIGVTFGSKTQEEWNSLFSQSFDILRKLSPGFMTEIELLIRKIIPFDVSVGIHNSGSYFNAIGHILMSYPIGMDHPELAILEAILHEYNHSKLNLIMQTEPLVLNDQKEIFYSPYRPDARHIYGIYLGLHALVGAYWVIWNAHTQGIITLSDTWLEKSALYVFKNGLSLQVLDRYGKFSSLGTQIFEEMRAVHMECLIFIKKAKSSGEIINRAKGSLVDHFHKVRADYPNILS